MYFRKDVFTEVNLTTVGCDFAEGWLKVNIQAKHPKGNWKKTDACLTTFELKYLIEWFEKIADGKEVENHLYFTEPCLEFELSKDEEKHLLRMSFSYELAPPWIKDLGEKFFIDFIVAEKELKRAAEDLRKELEKYRIGARK